MKKLNEDIIHDLVMLHLSKNSKATTIRELENEYQENFDVLSKIKKEQSNEAVKKFF